MVPPQTAPHFLLLLLALAWRDTAAAPLGVVTPLPNWEPSFVASSAQGTVAVAIQCCLPDNNNHTTTTDNNGTTLREDDDDDKEEDRDDEALLFLIRTPHKEHGSNVKTKDPSTSESTTTRFGLRFTHVQELQETLGIATGQTTNNDAGLVQVLSSSACPVLLVLTGFVLDVDYLQRVLVSELRKHDTIQAGDPLSVVHVAQLLGETVRDYTEDWNPQRPLGVQALLMGWTTTAMSKKSLRLYTTDPSGVVRSWNGGATAIGKDAHLVRRQLYKQMTKGREACSLKLQPEQALEAAVKALVASEEPRDDHDSNKDNDNYQVLLVWSDCETCAAFSGGWRRGEVDRLQIQEMIEQAWQQRREQEEEESSQTKRRKGWLR